LSQGDGNYKLCPEARMDIHVGELGGSWGKEEKDTDWGFSSSPRVQ